MNAFDQLYKHAAYLSMKNQKIKAEKSAHVDEDCTFKPAILTKSRPVQLSREEHLKKLMVQHNLKQRMKQDRTAEEVEYEKGKNECTFHPQISPFDFKTNADDRKAASHKRYLEDLQKGKKCKSPLLITGKFSGLAQQAKKYTTHVSKNPSSKGKSVLMQAMR